jgi:4'-phosphopantetheinyl transferase EntD
LTIVVVDVPQPGPDLDAALPQLPEAERALCLRWAPRRQATYVAGRLALRAALVAAGVVDDATASAIVVGRDDRGAPVLPASLPSTIRVSITHKDRVAGALVAIVDGADDGDDIDDVAWGLDLEVDDGRDREATDALARQVLLAEELASLPTDDVQRRRGVFARFSLKEALYKGLDPFLKRYVGFLDVSVDVSADDTAVFVVPFAGYAATGLIIGGLNDPDVVLTAARVHRRRRR